MSCGTGRVNRGIPPTTKQEKRDNALRFLNNPELYRTAATDEYVEVIDYLKESEEK